MNCFTSLFRTAGVRRSKILKAMYRKNASIRPEKKPREIAVPRGIPSGSREHYGRELCQKRTASAVSRLARKRPTPPHFIASSKRLWLVSLPLLPGKQKRGNHSTHRALAKPQQQFLSSKTNHCGLPCRWALAQLHP
jgi:hypothetical protein